MLTQVEYILLSNCHAEPVEALPELVLPGFYNPPSTCSG